MNQVNKIHKALKIIDNLLPNTYPKVNVKIYQTCSSMIAGEAKLVNRTYKGMCKCYDSYSKRNRKDYIDTKYYLCEESNIKHRKDYLEFSAIAGNPILINLENTINFTLRSYIFLLLHEIGHIYYTPKDKKYDEHLCDLFAIRWIKKLIKKGNI